MITEALAILFLAALSGGLVAAIYLVWPRRMTAEEWVLHRRRVSEPELPVSPAPEPKLAGWHKPVSQLRISDLAVTAIAPDLALLHLAGGRAPEDHRELWRQLGMRAGIGGAVGLSLAAALILLDGLVIQPGILALPLLGAFLLPSWFWLKLRRRAGELRRGIEHRLPRLLAAARALLESGAATPQGALDHVVLLHEDLASSVIREALRLRQVQGTRLESALEEAGQRYRIEPLAQLADSYRIASRHGTPVAQLLSEQSMRLGQRWLASYRERITRAPVTMTIPALVFFVLPLLVVIMFLIFTPLVGELSRL